MSIALLYTLFCLIAIAVNIGTQDLVVRLWPWPFAIAASIMAGTGTGLVVKYLLDKRYIFRFTAKSAVHDGQTFVLYTLMGVVTTLIFWGFEYAFWLGFGTDAMRYLGGVIGLVIGYITKYWLDKRFVFGPSARAAGPGQPLR